MIACPKVKHPETAIKEACNRLQCNWESGLLTQMEKMVQKTFNRLNEAKDFDDKVRVPLCHLKNGVVDAQTIVTLIRNSPDDRTRYLGRLKQTLTRVQDSSIFPEADRTVVMSNLSILIKNLELLKKD